MELKEITKIFIIESPSEDDLLEDRKEGFALSQILCLSQIKNTYFIVDSVENFKSTLKQISFEVKNDIKNYAAITLHFSMHGNQDGIEFTNSDFLNWDSLYRIIKEFNDVLGYITLPNSVKVAPVNLNFSVCKGFHAKAIKKMGIEMPYFSLIAPTLAVEWADSIMAFAALYHTTLHKGISIKIGVEKMNLINNFDDVFKIDLIDSIELK